MDVVVCVKSVPLSEQEIVINEEETGVVKENFKYEMNEWDSYALEEAVQLKEKLGGKVTVVTAGAPNWNLDFVLRECYAKGADEAVKVVDEAFEQLDPLTTAKVLAEVIKKLNYDLVLTGVQASDDNYTQTGVTLAKLLGLPHVSVVTKVGVSQDQKFLTVNQELEGGYEQIIQVSLPALLTIQTGINQPRYASLMKIRAAMKKEIKTLKLEDLGFTRDKLLGMVPVKVERVFTPKVEKAVKFLKGSPEEIAQQIVEILKDKGLIG